MKRYRSGIQSDAIQNLIIEATDQLCIWMTLVGKLDITSVWERISFCAGHHNLLDSTRATLGMTWGISWGRPTTRGPRGIKCFDPVIMRYNIWLELCWVEIEQIESNKLIGQSRSSARNWRLAFLCTRRLGSGRTGSNFSSQASSFRLSHSSSNTTQLLEWSPEVTSGGY